MATTRGFRAAGRSFWLRLECGVLVNSFVCRRRAQDIGRDIFEQVAVIRAILFSDDAAAKCLVGVIPFSLQVSLFLERVTRGGPPRMKREEHPK